MLLGVIADDFTGAGDIANTIAKGLPGQGGLKTAQFLGVPATDAPEDIEAGVVALKSRSIPAGEAVRQSLDALHWLQAQGCEQFIFKYCSTFDSTKDGNIGPVGEALAEALGAKGVVACPAFPTVGRTVYQGHLFVRDQLLNELGMHNHPLNPMTDSDIRRWLGYQTKNSVGLVAWPTVHAGHIEVAKELTDASGRGQILVIVDAISDEDLITIGKAVAGTKLVTGGSGIALGLPANFIAAGKADGSAGVINLIDGPEAILAGSCSGATLEQVEVHAKSHPTLPIDVDLVMQDKIGPAALVAFLIENRGKAPLAFSSGSPEDVRALQKKYGRDEVASKLDTLFADTAKTLVEQGVTRIVVAGGETSGAVVSALKLGALEIGSEIDPGVPVLISKGAKPIALALKSGNFGSPDFFVKALDRLAGR